MIITFELTRHGRCVHDGLPRRERQHVSSISHLQTGLELFHSLGVDNYLARRGKMRWQKVCSSSSNCSFTLIESTDGDMVRHKSLKLKNHKKRSQGTCSGQRTAEVFAKLAECADQKCTAAIAILWASCYGTPR